MSKHFDKKFKFKEDAVQYYLEHNDYTVSDGANRYSVPFDLIVDAEWNRRQANRLAKGIRSAGFAEPEASIEGIEY